MWFPRTVLLTAALGVASVAAACAEEDPNGLLLRAPPASTSARGDASGVQTNGTGAAPVLLVGVPCEVQRILENRCVTCHGTGTAPRLLGHEDLLAPAPSTPAKTVAQMSLERIKSTTRPMPPPPGSVLSAAEVAALEAWVSAGAPKGEACAPPPGAPPGPNPYATATVCTSGQTSREEKGLTMRPGRACIACHAREDDDAPRFDIAGTVYPTAHEPDDCEGVNGQVSVVISDLQGTVLKTLLVNRVGSFASEDRLQPPFQVKLVRAGVERVMVGPAPSGDCNSCHTVSGANGAPGRIMAP